MSNAMRILVMLNPTNKYGTKAQYTKLRDFLKSDGYLMVGQELFMRVTTNRKGAEKHIRRLEEYAPNTGVVRVLRLTEKQYENMWYLTGEPDEQEKMVGNHCHIML